MPELMEVKYASEEYKALLDIRYQVLRQPLGMELREKDTATDHEEYHFAAYENGAPIGCVLLKPQSQKGRIQLRQMAVLNDWRGKGIGARLVVFAENFSREKGYYAIEARARRNVQEFYAKLGYISHEHEFADEHTLKMIKLL